MLIVPTSVDVPVYRWPIANFIILGLIAVVFLLELGAPPGSIAPLVLDGWSFTGLAGHMWLHAGLGHLLGNGIFLWVFGNAVCARIGDLRYALTYVGLGLLSAVFWLLTSGDPVVGASGAINGIVGLYLVLFPLNDVSCFYWVLIRMGSFTVSSYWMILLWFAFDLWGAFSGSEGVAYLAHVGGFLAGFTLGYVLVKGGRIAYSSTETSLVAVLEGRNRRRSGGQKPSRAAPAAAPAGGKSSPHYYAFGAPKPRVGSAAAGASVTPTPASVVSQCPCGRRVRVPRDSHGKRYRCPACGAVRTIDVA